MIILNVQKSSTPSGDIRSMLVGLVDVLEFFYIDDIRLCLESKWFAENTVLDWFYAIRSMNLKINVIEV